MNAKDIKLLGEPPLAMNPDGTLKSRIGTIFFRTPGLVTTKGNHALQRIAWLRHLQDERKTAGLPPLSANDEADEIADSADLIFTDGTVLIRPDPDRMDLAFKADEALQNLVSKRNIRFLNTHSAKVHDALRARGENWRMARLPQGPEEMDRQIASSRCAIACNPIYHYNRQTGTRYLTAGDFTALSELPNDRLRAQMAEISHGIKAHNRLGQPEIGLFPESLPQDVRNAFRAMAPDEADDAALRAEHARLAQMWRAALPANLRQETVENFDWRNAMFSVLSKAPNETSAAEQDLIQGISPEFYRQIEWLPGGRMENGELIFDPLYNEAARTQDPDLLDLCDHRVRSILFNILRLFSELDYVNIGRISRSLARRPLAGAKRGSVYIVQCQITGESEPRIFIIRFQKWGVAERLDEGKDLLRAITESDDYADYILDRRLACRQLGMALPPHVGLGALSERYAGDSQYKGVSVRAYYYTRDYIPGTATDKIPPAKFRNPAFARRFAELMGSAAAIDLVVGRRATETGESVFDTNYEVIQYGVDGLPARLLVTDHAGSFVDYQTEFADRAPAYANAVRRRETFVTDFAAFAKAYVAAFRDRLARMQAAYRSRPRVFDDLFALRPVDTGGSIAYRWSCTLKRLAACNPEAVADALKKAIQS